MSKKQAKRKLLFIITKGNWGGAQKYVYNLATRLTIMGKFDVVVLLGEGNQLKNRLEKENVRVIQIKSLTKNINLKKDLESFSRIRKIIQEENPDIIHLNSSKVGFIGALAAKILNPKPHTLIFTAHGWAFNDKTFPWQKPIFKIIQWATVLISHTTIAVSQKTKKDVANWPFVSKKIKVIYNGLDTINFLSKEEAREKLLPEKKHDFWIGTVSELHKNKGLDILIKSVALLIKKERKRIALVIIGDGKEKITLQKLVEKNGIKDNVFFLGFVENAEIFLKSFDIFTLTSRTEGFPFVLLEAGLAKLPVIASKTGGIPEIIKKDVGIIVEKENILLLKEKIDFLINNSEERQKLAKNLEKKVKEEFTMEEVVKKTLLVYNS